MIVQQYKYKNGDLPVGIQEFIVRANLMTVFTGRMSSGKTSALLGTIQYINPKYPIRTAESTYELYVREAYPFRNVLGTSETLFISLPELQNFLKKSDGQVIIIGEASSNILVVALIEAAQVGSMIALGTHHATSASGLVLAFRNSLMAEGGYSNELIAESQVLEVLKFNTHLVAERNGDRFNDRITEIMRKTQDSKLPEYNPNDPIHSMNRITREFYLKSTNTTLHETQDIVKFNRKTRAYEPCNWFSPEMTERILDSLTDPEYERFRALTLKYWGSDYV